MIDRDLKPPKNLATRDTGVDLWTAERDVMAPMEVGCSCGWEGARGELEELGIDGEPLPNVHRDQISIEEALE